MKKVNGVSFWGYKDCLTTRRLIKRTGSLTPETSIHKFEWSNGYSKTLPLHTVTLCHMLEQPALEASVLGCTEQELQALIDKAPRCKKCTQVARINKPSRYYNQEKEGV